MQNSQFYKGMLFEMEKMGESATPDTGAGLKDSINTGATQVQDNFSHPQGGPGLGGIPTPDYQEPSPSLHHGGGSSWDAPVTPPPYSKLNLLGSTLGGMVDTVEKAPVVGGFLESGMEGYTDRLTRLAARRGERSPGEFSKGFLTGSANTRGYQNEDGALSQLSHGFKTFDNFGKLNTNIGHGVAQIGGELKDWLKSNGGGMLAGAGGGLLLSQLLGGGMGGQGVTNNYYGNQGQQQAPQGPQGPQFL
jgi:hypothetical protein